MLAVGIMDRFLAPIKVEMAALVRVVAELPWRAGVWPSLGKVRCPDSSSLVPKNKASGSNLTEKRWPNTGAGG